MSVDDASRSVSREILAFAERLMCKVWISMSLPVTSRISWGHFIVGNASTKFTQYRPNIKRKCALDFSVVYLLLTPLSVFEAPFYRSRKASAADT
jgi:hypothetical protein